MFFRSAGDNVDNDCDGDTDEDLRVDDYETNDECRTGEDLGAIPRDVVEPRNLTGTLYPDGDADWFTILVEEGRDICIPNWLEIDRDFEVTAQLSNVPEGVDFRLCVAVAFDEHPLTGRVLVSEACRGEVIAEEVCLEPQGADGVQTFTHTVRAICGANDNRRLLMRVMAPEGTPTFSCLPYTLSITSREL